MSNARLSLPLIVLLLATGCVGSESTGDKILRFITDETFDVTESTIDIEELAVGLEESPLGLRMGVGVKTVGGPAPASAYSNFVEVQVTHGDPPTTVSVTQQRHDGVDDTLTTGGLAEEDVEYVQRPWGHVFIFPAPPESSLRDRSTLIDIFLGFLGEENGGYEEDDVRDFKFKETVPVEDILSEIDEVFVPS